MPSKKSATAGFASRTTHARGADQSHIEAALTALIGALAELDLPWMVIGGIAVISHGVQRMTNDIDVVVQGDAVSMRSLIATLRRHKIVPRIANAETFAATNQVLLAATNRRGSISTFHSAGRPSSTEALAARTMTRFGETVAPMARVEDLLIFKAIAARPIDVRLALASARPLGAPEVKALDELAHKDPDQQLRTQAVNAVAYHAPALALPVLQAAFTRGDVDNGTANAIEDRKLISTTPAILGYLQRQPKAVRWLQTLAAFKATCAARAIASLLSDDTAGFPATEALRALSGHPDWSAAQLAAWAAQQPGDVGPCVDPSPTPPGRAPAARSDGRATELLAPVPTSLRPELHAGVRRGAPIHRRGADDRRAPGRSK